MPAIIHNHNTSLNSNMKFFNGGFKNTTPSAAHGRCDLASSHGSPSPNSTAAPTLEELSGTAWCSSTKSDAVAKVGRSKHVDDSRRSSMDSITKEKSSSSNKQKLRHSMHSMHSRSERGLLDGSASSRTSRHLNEQFSSSERGMDLDGSRHEFRRSANADPPSGNEVSSSSKGKTKDKKKKRQQDAPEERSANKGGNSEQKNVQEPSFQDVLKNLNGNKASTNGGLGLVQEENPFVVPSAPETAASRQQHAPKSNTLHNPELNLPGFKSTPAQPTDTLQALLNNAQNFSSDCSVGTMNTTTQCAISLAKLIEEMQAEFQKLKRQKNKAESYAEKLHTDYVRMQEGLERDYEKACQERDELKVAREKDTMAMDKLKEEVKALKSENAALKESTRAEEERRKVAEEENGRMKVALEALLVRSGAVKKDGKMVLEDGGCKRGKKDKLSDRANSTSRAFNNLHLERRNSSSLPNSPEVYQSRSAFGQAMSDHAKPNPPFQPKSVDSIKPYFERNYPNKTMPMPFNSRNQRGGAKKIVLPFNVSDGFEECERRNTNSTESSTRMSSGEDIQSVGSNSTNDHTFDGSLDIPTPN